MIYEVLSHAGSPAGAGGENYHHGAETDTGPHESGAGTWLLFFMICDILGDLSACLLCHSSVTERIHSSGPELVLASQSPVSLSGILSS